MRTPRLAALLVAAFAGLAACGGGVTVRRSAASAPPKRAGCELEILRKAPDRPYDVLATLESHVTNVPREGALSIVQPKACELGADAIVVLQNMVLNELGHTFVAATAIRYRAEAPPAVREAPLAPAETAPDAPKDPAR
jgi:hypothetical protein